MITPTVHHSNSSSSSSAIDPQDMLIEVDFKWLMAGQGRWVDSVRLYQDPAYAHDCLTSALCSDCEPLRRCALYLHDRLGGLRAT